MYLVQSLTILRYGALMEVLYRNEISRNVVSLCETVNLFVSGVAYACNIVSEQLRVTRNIAVTKT